MVIHDKPHNALASMEAWLARYIQKEQDNRNSLIDKHRAAVYWAVFEYCFS